MIIYNLDNVVVDSVEDGPALVPALAAAQPPALVHARGSVELVHVAGEIYGTTAKLSLFNKYSS